MITEILSIAEITVFIFVLQQLYSLKSEIKIIKAKIGCVPNVNVSSEKER